MNNLADTGITTHAAFFDYDKDGDLDVIQNSFIPVSSLNYSNKRDLRDKDWDVAEILKEEVINYCANDTENLLM
jgi:hypothetical protein